MSSEASKGTFAMFVRLAKMVNPHKSLLLASVICGILGQLCSIGLMAFSASAAAMILTKDGFPVFPVSAAVICGLVRGGLRYGEHYFGHDIAFRLLFDIRKNIFNAINRLAPAKLLDRKTGDICSAVMADVEYVETFFAHTLAPIIIGTVVPLTVLVIAGMVDPRFSIVLLPFYLLAGIVVPVLSFRSAADFGLSHRNLLSGMNSRMVESLQGLRELMLLGREKEKLDSLLDDTKQSSESYRKIRANEGTLASLVEIIVIIASASVISLAAFLVSAGLIEAGEAVFMVVLGMTSFGPLISLMFLSNNLVNTSAAAKRIFALLDEEPLVKNPAEDRGGCITGFGVESAPVASEVNFAYPGADVQVLSDFSLEFEKGKISALKAESGRGKSTILYLMIRFFDPVSGSMLLGKESLKHYELDELRSSISYFTQDTTLFNTTVMENIRMADRSASDEDVFRAAEKAGIHDFISGLPNGYRTLAGERGSRFSSGERQRMGLARIFLQNNDVILLDEPVSNLDHENEQLIMRNLKAGLSGKTVVLVSHRKSVIELADNIIEI